ncbi:hypothetical protein [Arthrobacter globiformis]|uniref:hypothetical protein n=1 Tax=Arthrobacter globiformis TaxID=1665 RepID=UPI0027937154|nr:hypothetical protein [Arthrobacter globiformis]MDQ0619202.1 hypothetical protein [Arthrobacter globiformis]
MTAPTVEAAIHELMDLAWNVVYGLLEERGLLGGGFFVEECTGIHSWLDGPVRYTVVHSCEVAVLFVDTRPVDAIVFHHDLLGADDDRTHRKRLTARTSRRSKTMRALQLPTGST